MWNEFKWYSDRAHRRRNICCHELSRDCAPDASRDDAIFNHDPEALNRWIAIRPHNALTVLDTHDGIGIIDIGADTTDRANRPGLISPQSLDQLVETIHRNSQNQSRDRNATAIPATFLRVTVAL